MTRLRTARLVAAFGLVACLALPRGGLAQDTDADVGPNPAAESEDADAEARAHFEAATEYFDNTEYEDALVEFRYAYSRASPSARPAMLFNIAATLERLGRFDESADALERYLDDAEDPESPARLRARIVSLRRRADANRPAEEASGGDGLVVAAGVTLGVAAAGWVAFGILGGLALAEDSSVQEGCFAAGSCTPDDVATLESLTLGADVSWVSAAALSAVGVTLLVLGMAQGQDDERVSVTPWLSPTAAGVSAAGISAVGAF